MSTNGYNDDQLKQVAKLIARHFIARSDAVAEQHDNGAYSPVRRKVVNTEHGESWELVPIQMAHLMNHLRGNATIGHYLLDKDNNCKLMVFDIDIDKAPTKADPTLEELCLLPHSYRDGEYREFLPGDGRLAWKTDLEGKTFQPGGMPITREMQMVMRDFLRYQLRRTADLLTAAITENLQIPTLCAYTGNKGLHVYGFTGLISAADVRDGAEIVAEAAKMRPFKGQNFWKPEDSFAEPCALTVEIFPKQTEISADGFGNLVQLPLGRNKKNPRHPKFFCSTNIEPAVNERITITPVDTLQAFATAFDGF